MSQETYKEVLSTIVSKYLVYPLLAIEMVVQISLNSNLMYCWYTQGGFNTMVNKIIVIQRVCGSLYSLGCLIDFYFRVYEAPPSQEYIGVVCTCWMVFYKMLAYTNHSLHLVMALVRFFSIKYPLQYHNRQVFFLFQTHQEDLNYE